MSGQPVPAEKREEQQTTPAAGLSVAVSVSDTAAKTMHTILKDKNAPAIRLGVSGGGCAGLQYEMEPAQAPAEGEQVHEVNGVTFYIHPKVMLYLTGIHIDYTDSLVNGGFKFSNPNATSSCGCGTSFGVS